MIFLLMWVALAIFLLSSGLHRIGFSMLCPICTPFLFLDWCYKKWHGQSTSDF